jgi:hypothetical protein
VVDEHKEARVGHLFARAFTQQVLLDAWATVREAALADGRPDPEVDRFEADAARRVAALAEELTAGAWRPSPAYRVEIPKRSGGIRVLVVPTLAHPDHAHRQRPAGLVPRRARAAGQTSRPRHPATRRAVQATPVEVRPP